ncbi:MAG: hypothetical protein GX489_05750 [Firmicutes bacterium]|jgi:hypothetical protein|nr:hypothetical protein [Bacillota bacterium]
MKQLFPKAVFYKEWKSARWGLALFILLFVSKLFDAIQRLNNLKELAQCGELVVANSAYWFQQLIYGNSIFLLIFVLTSVLAYLLFYQDRQEATASLIGSLPFTKEQAFNVKWITGAGIIVMAFLVNGLLLTGFYFANRAWMFSTAYQVIPTWTALHLVFALAAFSFMLFVQCAMGHSLAAAAVGPIAGLVPLFFFAGLNDIVRYQFNLSYDNVVSNFLDRLTGAVNWLDLISASYVQNTSGIVCPVYDNMPVRIVVFLAITVIFLWLGRIAYQQNAVEKSGELLMFPFLEPVLIYGFALCLGLLLALMFGLGYGENSVLVMDAFLVGGFVGGWFLAKRVVAYYQH